jgi:hypothetical protein
MVILAGAYIQNPELIEVCEKLFVDNIDMLQAEEGGASFILEAMEGFQSSVHSRPKIFEVLVARLANDFDQLDIEE